MRRLPAAVLAAVCVVLLAGCTAEQPAPPAAPVAIQALSPEAKSTYVAPSFPAEVPVPDGEFTRAEDQGGDAWDYTVVVKARPADLAAWYKAAYGAANWVLKGEAYIDRPDAPGGVEYTFTKNAAESRVLVYGEEQGPATAEVILGVGAPVLQTQ